ncbi:MAG: carbonic anhydrase [Gemmatimonas sp.]
MDHFARLIKRNKEWAASMKLEDPEFFSRRSAHQEPHFLFIGCSDSRVPAELLTGAAPGEVFTHRNIANQVFPTDMNMLSVMKYAIDVLDVEHVLVCGHYGCGGVKASLGTTSYGIVDYWLSNIRYVARTHQAELDSIADEGARLRRLTDLNVIEQVYQLSRSPIVQSAWGRGRRPNLHGLVYDLNDGMLKTLVTGIDSLEKASVLQSGGHDTRRPVGAGSELAISL